MTDPFFRTVSAVLNRGKMSNSYKPALLRSLAAYGQEACISKEITWGWLAEKFLEFYWPLAVTFRVRQANDPTRDPVIMRLIRERVAEHNLPSTTALTKFKSQHREEYEALVNDLKNPGQRCCLDEVIPRFHNVGGSPPARLYKQGDGYITLSDESLPFLQSNHETLRLLAIGRWVKFTERFSSAPRLYEKIEGTRKRVSLARFRTALSDLEEFSKCFYCGTPADENFEVDHFLPWSFVLENKAWNLVPACRACNSSKSDSLAPEWRNNLAARNERLLAQAHNSGPGTSISKDLREWSVRSLQQHVDVLVDSALAEGFSIWTDSPGQQFRCESVLS